MYSCRNPETGSRSFQNNQAQNCLSPDGRTLQLDLTDLSDICDEQG
jgi:hypothetical protein